MQFALDDSRKASVLLEERKDRQAAADDSRKASVLLEERKDRQAAAAVTVGSNSRRVPAAVSDSSSRQ